MLEPNTPEQFCKNMKTQKKLPFHKLKADTRNVHSLGIILSIYFTQQNFSSTEKLTIKVFFFIQTTLLNSAQQT